MSATRKISSVEPQPWDLSQLQADGSAETLAAQTEKLEAMVSSFETYRSKLSAALEPQQLSEILAEYEALQEEMAKLGAFASLRFAADTQDEGILSFKNRVEELITGLFNRVLFFDLWWKQLGQTDAERLLGQIDKADDRHYLKEGRRLATFSLEENLEQVINLKDSNGMSGLLTLYSMLTNRMEFHLQIEGEEKVMTRDEIAGLAFSPHAELRQAAYEEIFRVFDLDAGLLAQIYGNRVRDWRQEQVELRRFPSPIGVRNRGNDIPDEAVDVLLQTASERAEVFQRYFRLKARHLGVERLRRYDIYAPLAASDRRVVYGDAVDLVLSTLHDFDARFAAAAKRVFDDGHMDSEVRKGKKGGAFCATVLPSQTPWVLMNYNGRLRDVSTMAHELGHAVHSQMAAGHSILTQQPSLPLAETASVFAEMLLTERLLAQESSERARVEILSAKLDDIYATVQRQAFFTIFELRAHRAIAEGAAPRELNEIYFQSLQQQFGDSVDVAGEFAAEWIAIPHFFHTPFYCYAYSFGQLLVLALFRRFQEEGSDFVPHYLELLAHGGSERPEIILREAGIEIQDVEFWRGGYEVIASMVDELEALS